MLELIRLTAPLVMSSLLNHHPKCRVELHIHLEGAVRPATIYALAMEKKVRLVPDGKQSNPDPNSYNEIMDAVTITKPISLCHFLQKIDLYIPLLVGDLAAIERIAWEMVEDESKEHVLYFESRYSPHFLSNMVASKFVKSPLKPGDPKAVSPQDVIQAVQRGFERAEKEFGTKARHILCSIKGTGWTDQIVDLANEFRAFVVGIDIAGNESHGYSHEEIKAFQRAKQLGIHRTVHAGEAGPAENVKTAIDKLAAERIGHGYKVIEDEQIYKECKAKRVHFEVCPYSSYLTNAVSKKCVHPVIRLAIDDANFSINKDDPTVTHSTLDSEYLLLIKMGFSEMHFVRANLNSARSSFLPAPEKEELVNQLSKVYGFIPE